jgi:hypothetical protein
LILRTILVAGAAVLVSSPGSAASWDMSCLYKGKVVYAERLESEAEAKASAGRGRTRFPESVCIVSDATPSQPTPILGALPDLGVAMGGGGDDLTSALMALAGREVPTGPALVLPLVPQAAAPQPKPFVAVVPDPDIEPDHVRVAVYEGVPTEIVIADFDRLRAAAPVLTRYFPLIETSRTGRIFVDVGPIPPLRVEGLCRELSSAGSKCVRSPVPARRCAKSVLASSFLSDAIACMPDPEPLICPANRFGVGDPDPMRDILFLASTVP